MISSILPRFETFYPSIVLSLLDLLHTLTLVPFTLRFLVSFHTDVYLALSERTSFLCWLFIVLGYNGGVVYVRILLGRYRRRPRFRKLGSVEALSSDRFEKWTRVRKTKHVFPPNQPNEQSPRKDDAHQLTRKKTANSPRGQEKGKPFLLIHNRIGGERRGMRSAESARFGGTS